MMDDYLPHSYIYLNAFMLAFGVWAMAAPDNTEPVLMVCIRNREKNHFSLHDSISINSLKVSDQNSCGSIRSGI